jgi:hypothetical protein
VTSMDLPSTQPTTSQPTREVESAPPLSSVLSRGSSNLYLVTFLATLFLLLFVSFAIVLRSYILRSRFRRQLREAGIILDSRSRGTKKRRSSVIPKIFDIWLVQGGETWEETMPVSAQPLYTKRRVKESKTTPSQQVSISNPNAMSLPSPLRWQFWRSSTPVIPIPPPTAVEPAKARSQVLQVAVLVSMPSPNRAHQSLKHQSQEEVVFGILRLPYKPEQEVS